RLVISRSFLTRFTFRRNSDNACLASLRNDASSCCRCRRVAIDPIHPFVSLVLKQQNPPPCGGGFCIMVSMIGGYPVITKVNTRLPLRVRSPFGLTLIGHMPFSS